jgi:excisionase family DNA binding protein
MNSIEQPEREYMTPAELAQRLNVSQKSVTNWTQARRLPGMVKIGRVWRYERRAIERNLRAGSLLLKAE